MFFIINNDADYDLWHRMAVGSVFFNTGTILYHDIYSYLPTKTLWIDHEWGSGVIFYFFYNNFGDTGLFFLKIICFLAVIFLIWKTIKLINNEENKYRILYFSCLIIGLLPGFLSTIRSQVFTYVLFTLFIYLLERLRKNDNKIIWIFPAIMLVWTNVHGGFLSGLGLIAIYIIGETINKKRTIKYLSIFIVSSLVTLINPYGIQFWLFMSEAVTMPRPYITEWQPLNLFDSLTNWIGFKIFLTVVIVGYAFKLASGTRKFDWTKIIVLLVTFYLSIKHQRHCMFFIITAAIFGYEYFYQLLNYIWNKLKINLENKLNFINSNLGIFTVYTIQYIPLVIIIGGLCLMNKPTIKVPETMYPVHAVEFIKINKLNGNLLTCFNWGSYVLWKLYPQCLVSIDGRYEEVYPNNIYEEISTFSSGISGWDKVLSKYKNDIILIYTNSKTYKKLKKLKNWKLIYQDKWASVFIPTKLNKLKWNMPKIKTHGLEK